MSSGIWNDFEPNETGYQTREVAGLLDGYFVAQWALDEAHIIEAERGNTMGILKRRNSGRWELMAEWAVDGDINRFRSTGLSDENPEAAALLFNRYIDGISRPWTITQARYVAWGGKVKPHLGVAGYDKSGKPRYHRDWSAGHEAIVRAAVQRGEFVPDNVAADYPDLDTQSGPARPTLRPDSPAFITRGELAALSAAYHERGCTLSLQYSASDRAWRYVVGGPVHSVEPGTVDCPIMKMYSTDSARDVDGVLILFEIHRRRAAEREALLVRCAGKQLWEMTLLDAIEWKNLSKEGEKAWKKADKIAYGGDVEKKSALRRWCNTRHILLADYIHFLSVKDAIEKGKPVPDEVLAEHRQYAEENRLNK